MKHFENRGFRIQYDSWGDPSHRPALFFHGFPGSHVQARALIPLLAQNHMRLIACDRPGYGGTTGRGTTELYLHAILGLVEHLGISQFHIIGVSGGAPFAHMMASMFAEKVRSLSVICGLATYNRETRKYFSKLQNRAIVARKLIPQRVAEVIINNAPKRFDPDTNPSKLLSLLCSEDREIINVPHNAQLLSHSMNHARIQGARGIAADSGWFHRDWLRENCDIERLSSLPTFYYHGVNDRILDYRMSEWMHKRTRNSQLRYFEDEGHYSLPFRRADFILKNLRPY